MSLNNTLLSSKNFFPQGFLWLSLTFGLIFTFIIPPFAFDIEKDNFYYAYSLTHNFGKDIVENKNVVSLPKHMTLIFETEKSGESTYNKYIYHNGNIISKYSDYLEVPLFLEPIKNIWTLFVPMLGILLAKIFLFFNLPISPFSMLFFARIFNTICFSVLGYQMLKKLQLKKEILFLILLSPMLITFSSTVNSLMLPTLASLFYVYMILEIVFLKQKSFLLSLDQKYVFYLAILIALFLPIILLPLLILLFINTVKNKEDKKKMMVFTIILSVVAILNFILHLPNTGSFKISQFIIPDISQQFFVFLDSLFVDQQKINFFPNAFVHFLLLFFGFLLFTKSEKQVIFPLKDRMIIWIFMVFYVILSIFIYHNQGLMSISFFHLTSSYIFYPIFFSVFCFTLLSIHYPLFKISDIKKNISVILFSSLLLVIYLFSIILSLYY